MTDDPIRALLAGLTPAPFIWSRPDTVVIMDEHVQEAGANSGVTSIPKPKGKTYYVVPETELAG